MESDPAGSDSEHVAESWSKTEQYKVRGRHRWSIDNFLRRASCTEVGDSLCSPVFVVPVEAYGGDVQDLAFQLEVFPNGEEGEDNSDYVAVFLTSRRQEDLDVKYDFSVQKADGTCWGRIGNTFKKFSPDQNSWGYGKAFSKAKLNEKASELLPGNKLTIVCNLEIYYSDRLTGGKVPSPHDTQTELERLEATGASLSEDLASAASFLPDARFSDVTLVCGNRSFACHKVILSARSDVFSAMFSHSDTVEVRTNVVEIADVEPDALEQMLRFIYTDKVDETAATSFACGLLTAADKYNVPRLKAVCERVIAENIDVPNAAQTLVLAHLHEAKVLKKVALDFVTQNIARVSETTGWDEIVNGKEVLGEIIKSIMKSLIISTGNNCINGSGGGAGGSSSTSNSRGTLNNTSL